MGRIICFDWKNIDTIETRNIESATQKLLLLLVDVQVEQLWAHTDSVFQKDVSRSNFVDFTYTFAERIVSLQGISFLDGKLILVKRKLNHPVRISCNSSPPKSGDSYQLKIWPGLQKIAVVFFEKKYGFVSHRIVVVIGQRGDGEYRLISLFINPFTFTGRDAAYYQDLGARSGNNGDLLSSFWFYRLASMLSQTGPVIQFDNSLLLMKTIKAMYAQEGFRQKIGQLTVHGKKYSLFDLAFIELEDELIPIVAYLSYYDGTKRDAETADKIEAESVMLYKALRKSHPAVFEEFPSVMFQAYFEPPIDPAKKYPFFKVRVDPSVLNK